MITTYAEAFYNRESMPEFNEKEWEANWEALVKKPMNYAEALTASKNFPAFDEKEWEKEWENSYHS